MDQPPPSDKDHKDADAGMVRQVVALTRSTFTGPVGKSVITLMAAAFGTSAIEFTDAAARMGGLLKGAGYSAADAAKLSVAMVKLSNDASSFFNTDFDKVATEELPKV